MEKRISYDIFMSVKRIAQACNPFYAKRDKVKRQIEKLASEYKAYETQIQSLEAGIKAITGFRVEELVKKVVEPALREDGAPQLTSDGKPVRTTKYVPTDMVSYDKEHKQYVISVPDGLHDAGAPVTDAEAPSDYAAEAEPEENGPSFE